MANEWIRMCCVYICLSACEIGFCANESMILSDDAYLCQCKQDMDAHWVCLINKLLFDCEWMR